MAASAIRAKSESFLDETGAYASKSTANLLEIIRKKESELDRSQTQGPTGP